MIHPRCVRCIQVRSKDSRVKTQLVLWIFILLFYLRQQGDNMFRLVSPGHHQVISNEYNLRKLDTVIHKNGSHRLKMQRDLVAFLSM